MSLGVSVQIVVDGIFAAYERQDWSAIQRLGERVRMMILDGVADKDRGGLSEVASKLEIAHAMLPVAAGETLQLEIGWMLKADATLAKLAARRIPAPASAAGTDERSARDKILRALIEANAPLRFPRSRRWPIWRARPFRGFCRAWRGKVLSGSRKSVGRPSRR